MKLTVFVIAESGLFWHFSAMTKPLAKSIANLQHMAISEPFRKENHMIRKHTTFVDKSIETADRAAYMAAKKLESALTDLAMKISLDPERSIAGVQRDLCSIHSSFETHWEADAFSGFAWAFFKAAKIAHRTETILKVKKPSRNSAVRAVEDIPDEQNVMMVFDFFRKSEKQSLAGICIFFGELGDEIGTSCYSHQEI